MKKPRQKLFRAALFAVAFLLLGFGAYAQKSAISGAVTSAEDGEPLPGVSILIKGTSIGTISDENGQFSLEAAEGDILIFSYVGFVTEEISVVGGQSVYNMALSPDLIRMSELVVIGYGSVKKAAVTGSSSNVSSEELAEVVAPTLESKLQGRASGVSITNNGSPGSEPIVHVRGIGSINYNTQPLYVVDGVPVQEIGSFNSNDIESIEVLKDASATAIYGSRAANGVILITTKGGSKDGQLHVSVDAKMGVQSIAKKFDLLNNEEYVWYATEMGEGTAPPRINDPANWNEEIYEGAGRSYAETDTDWFDALFQSGKIMETNATVSLSNEKSNYFLSGGYIKNEGIMVGTDYERFSYRINSDHNLTKNLKIGQTLMFSNSYRNDEKRTQGRSNIMHLIRSIPYLPVYDPTLEGGFRAPDGTDGPDPDNPVKVQELFASTRAINKIFGTAYLELKLTDFLTFKTIAGLDMTTVIGRGYEPIYDDGYNRNAVAGSRKQTNETKSRLFTNMLTFDKKFNDHSVNVVVVAEQQSTISERMYITGSLETNAVRDLTGLQSLDANGSTNEDLLLSYLGRVNYGFKDKYFVSASYRSDGSSKLAPGNKWASFPAASVGWRISEEPFMQSVAAISELKLRGGYGVVGTSGLGAYDWQSTISNNTDYIFDGTTRANGGFYNKLPNTELSWELSTTINVGIDLGLFDDKLTLTAEYFNRETDDLILNKPLPASLGYSQQPPMNIGSMVNKGMEFEVGLNLGQGDFKSNISANASFIKNEVLSLDNETSFIAAGNHPDVGADAITRTDIGNPIQYFYGWKVEKIFESQAEVDALTRIVDGQPVYYQNASTTAGDIKFVDLNGDGVINSEDKTKIGSHMPAFSYGLNYSGTYKNFDFSLFIQGVQGNDVYNGMKVIREGMVRLFGAGTEVLNAWTPSNTNTDVPRIVSGDPNSNARVSDRFIEDGSYLRLRSLSVGYTLPKSFLSSISESIASVRLYVSAQNLLTLTSYTGLDPEVGIQVPAGTGGLTGSGTQGGLLTQGIDFGFVPTPRTIMGGISINF